MRIHSILALAAALVFATGLCMTPLRAPHPTKVRSPRGAAITEIDWSDGSTTRHMHRTLRGFCPCAQCQGHDRGIQWVESVESASKLTLEIKDIEQVGNYAIGLSWGDGHAGGIYTFEYLRELGTLFDRDTDQLRAWRPRDRSH